METFFHQLSSVIIVSGSILRLNTMYSKQITCRFCFVTDVFVWWLLGVAAFFELWTGNSSQGWPDTAFTCAVAVWVIRHLWIEYTTPRAFLDRRRARFIA